MGRLTTHVLDTAAGAPAAGLTIELFRLDGGETRVCRPSRTNDDGRVDGPLLEGDALTAGVYELRFHAGDYLAPAPRPAGPGLSRRGADPLRHRRAGRALPRAAAAFALRLFHLSGKLMRPTIRFIRKSRAGRARRCRPDDAAARLSARDRRRDRHQGRLRRGRLRRLHGGASAACATAGSSTSRSMPASCFSARSTAPRW